VSLGTDGVGGWVCREEGQGSVVPLLCITLRPLTCQAVSLHHSSTMHNSWLLSFTLSLLSTTVLVLPGPLLDDLNVQCLLTHPAHCMAPAGPNLPFYSSFAGTSSSSSPSISSSSPGGGLSLTGLEPNTAMWGYAQQAAAAAGLGQQQLQLVEGDAQQMPFDSSSFDAAVMTLVRQTHLPGQGGGRKGMGRGGRGLATGEAVWGWVRGPGGGGEGLTGTVALWAGVVEEGGCSAGVSQ